MCCKTDGVEGVVTSCSKKVEEGMVIHTKDELAEKVRKLSVDLMFKTHPSECTGCPKYGKCQLASISQYVGDTGRDLREQKIRVPANEENPLMLHEMYRCILCGRCVRACGELRGVGALTFKKVDGRMQVVINGGSLEEQAAVSVEPVWKSVQPVQSVTRSAYLKRDYPVRIHWFHVWKDVRHILMYRNISVLSEKAIMQRQQQQ